MVTKLTRMSFPILPLHCLAEPTPVAHVRDPADGNDAGKNSEQSSLKMLLSAIPSRASVLNQNRSSGFLFDTFSSREPGSTSLENALKRDHAADGFSALHQFERVVDFAQRHHMRDHRVDLDLALHVPVDDFRHVTAPARAAKGGALPHPPGDELERTGRNLSACRCDANDDRL